MERRLGGGGHRDGTSAVLATMVRAAAWSEALRRRACSRPGSVATATEAERHVPSSAPAASGAIGDGAAAMVARERLNRKGTFMSWVFTALHWVWVWSGLQFVSATICATLSWLAHPVIILWGWWRTLVADEYADHLYEAVFLLIVLAVIAFISGVLRRRPGSAATATEAQRRVPSSAPAASGAIGVGAAVMVAWGCLNRMGTFMSWVFTALYWVWVWSGLQFVSATICATLSWLARPVIILWEWWPPLVADEYADHLCEAVFLLIVLAPIVFISVLKAMLE
uniref:Uncharacterized protein n=1 Tax=Oryza punctata TaxID=4537 RepID=A0A0E0M6E4_ORYPU